MQISTKLIVWAILTIIGGGATGAYLATVEPTASLNETAEAEEVKTIEPEAPVEAPSVAEVVVPVTEEDKPKPSYQTPIEGKPTYAPNAPTQPSTTLPSATAEERAELKGLTEAEIGRPVVLAPGTVVQEEDKGRIMTAKDYVLTWSGVCPSQQVKSVFWDKWSKNAALGAWSAYPSLEYFIDQSWSEYNAGTLSGPNFNNVYKATMNGLDMMDTHPQAWRVIFFIDYNTRTVTWGDGFNTDALDSLKMNGGYPAEWDEMTARGTAYLRGLFTRYAALCPND